MADPVQNAAFPRKLLPGSLRLRGAQATPNWAIIEANDNQILAYAKPDGDEKGAFFGAATVLSSTGLLAVDSGKQELSVYDLSSSQQREQYVFGSPVEYKVFSEDGKRLFVFTNDQTVYFLDVTATESASASAATVN